MLTQVGLGFFGILFYFHAIKCMDECMPCQVHRKKYTGSEHTRTVSSPSSFYRRSVTTPETNHLAQ